MSSSPKNPVPDLELMKKRLNLLTARQRLVLRLYLVDGLTQEEVGSRLGIAQSTVSTHRADAFKKLEVLDTPAHLNMVRQALEQVPMTPEEEQILRDVKTKQQEEVNQKFGQIGQGINDSRQSPPPPQPNWRMLGVAGAAVALGLLLGWLLFGQTRAPQPAAVERTVVATPTPGPTQTPWVITATPEPFAAADSAPNAPNQTPSPEATQTPKPGTLSLPFIDKFDEGLGPHWIAESGDWQMRNGWLVNIGRRGVVWLGPQEWTNIAVEFEIARTFCNGSIVIMLRMQDPDNYVGYNVVGCNDERIFVVRNGQIVKDIVWTYSTPGRHRFEVRGKVYKVFHNGQLAGTGTDNTFTSGSVGIIIEGAAQQIDNFEVKLLN